MVDELVPVGQERPDHPRPAAAAQAAEQEPAVVPVEPPVDVRVVQAGLLLAELAQLGAGNAELVSDPLITHLGRRIRATGHGHAVRAEHRIRLLHYQPRPSGVDRGGRGDDVDLAGLRGSRS